MDKNTSFNRSQKLNELKINEKLDGLLALDNRGFAYHNDGFPKKNYNIKTLHQLSQYFFPGLSKQTIVTVEGISTLTTIQQTNNQQILALRIKKTQKQNN